MEVTGTTHVSDKYVTLDIDTFMATVQVEITSPEYEKERHLTLIQRANGPDGRVHTVEVAVVLPTSDKPFLMVIQTEIYRGSGALDARNPSVVPIGSHAHERGRDSRY